MSAALDRALERGLASHGRRALPAVQAPAGVGGASAVLAAAAGEGSGLGALGRGQPAYNHAEQYRRNQGWVFACFPTGTPVSTPEGVSAIEDVRVGDVVLNHRGEPAAVTEDMHRAYTGCMVTLTAVGLPPVRATAEHPFLVWREGREAWVNAREVMASDQLLMPVPAGETDRDTFRVQVENDRLSGKDPRRSYGVNLPVGARLMRLIGLFLAEGHARMRRSGSGRTFPSAVAFIFAAHETDYMDFVDESMTILFGAKRGLRVEGHGGSCFTLVYPSRLAADFFFQFGHGAENKFLPEWVQRLPVEKTLPLLRGYWEGDGCLGDRRFHTDTASRDLTEGVRRLWLRIGAFACLGVRSAGEQYFAGYGMANRREQYRLSIGGGHARIAAAAVGLELTDGAAWNAGSNLATVDGPWCRIPVRSVSRETVEGVAVHNLEVEGEHTYLAQGVAVHNCVRAIAQRWAGQPIRVARSKSRKGGSVPRALRPRREFLPRFLKSTQEQLELVDDHPILDVIDRPNSLMVRWSLGFVTAASLELTGKSYWWVYEGARKTDPPWTIMPLPSSWVEPRHRGTRLNASYLIRPANAFEPYEVPGEEIACLHYPDPGNPLGALSPLQAMSRSVAAHESISEAQRRSFVNGIWGGYAVTVGRNPDAGGQPGQRPVLTKDQRNQIVNVILQAYRGVLNYDQPVILDGIIESISKISNSPREMDFLKSKSVCKEEITQGFGVNPIILGEIEGANRASSATADDHFAGSCLNPKLELASQILTAVVAPRFAAPGERLVLYYEPAHAYDPDLEMARWKFLLDNACADVNEVRQAMGLAPRPGGNVALLPVALAPYDLDTPHDFSGDAAPPAGAGDGKPGGSPGGGGGRMDAVDSEDRGTDKAFHVDGRMGCYVSGG